MQPFALRWLILFILVVLLLAACGDSADGDAATIAAVEANEEAYIEAFFAQDLDAFMDTFAEDAIFVDETFGDYLEGKNAINAMYTSQRDPDMGVGGWGGGGWGVGVGGVGVCGGGGGGGGVGGGGCFLCGFCFVWVGCLLLDRCTSWLGRGQWGRGGGGGGGGGGWGGGGGGGGGGVGGGGFLFFFWWGCGGWGVVGTWMCYWVFLFPTHFSFVCRGVAVLMSSADPGGGGATSLR